jgi:hypothetical protein
MTNEDYYGHMKIMFQQEGWSCLQEDLQDNYRVINDITATSDENDLHFRKGQMAVLAYMINLEETIRMAEVEDESLE